MIFLPVVFEIAKAVPVRYRALVLLATFADMRWGEPAGLRRENLDLDACEIRIKETLAQLDKGGLRADTPKSQAGKRTVAAVTAKAATRDCSGRISRTMRPESQAVRVVDQAATSRAAVHRRFEHEVDPFGNWRRTSAPSGFARTGLSAKVNAARARNSRQSPPG